MTVQERVLGGRYRLVRELARGGMAVVWEAHDLLLDRPVAVKQLHPQYANEPEFLERFRREARAAASLSHPNVVPIFDVGEDPVSRAPFIVMELVQGQNLKDHIRAAAPLSDAELRATGAALADTLEYAHQRGLIHRDVKPQNVLIDPDGRPRLTDFGIAQALASSQLTRTGAIMGSVQYLAPELVRGRPASPQSDIYSLGAVLYEMATARVPFSGDSDLAIALAHVEGTPPAPRALNARLSPTIEGIILRALSKAPEARYASAAALAAALRASVVEAPIVAGASVAATRQLDGATQRIATVPVQAVASGRGRAAAAPGPARRATRPRRGPGASGGVLALLLALAVVLVALGAGFFGLATLSREGIATPESTARPTAQATAPGKPVVVPSPTREASPPPAPTATSEPPTAVPTPSPSPSPPTATAVPATATPVPPTRVPPTATPRTISTPNLRGRTLQASQAALQAAGLTVMVRGVNVDADKDVVVDQTPEAGTPLPPGGTVVISVGTGNTPVPPVAGRSRDEAARILQDNSFRVVIRERRDENVPAGQAIGTSPQAGAVVERRSEVELAISTGR